MTFNFRSLGNPSQVVAMEDVSIRPEVVAEAEEEEEERQEVEDDLSRTLLGESILSEAAVEALEGLEAGQPIELVLESHHQLGEEEEEVVVGAEAEADEEDKEQEEGEEDEEVRRGEKKGPDKEDDKPNIYLIMNR